MAVTNTFLRIKIIHFVVVPAKKIDKITNI